jgi:dihydroorotase
MKKTLLTNCSVVSNGMIAQQDVYVVGDTIEKVGPSLQVPADDHYDGAGRYLLPGVIDGQVHFRDPGLTHKGDLFTESKAAIAGGVTSIIDMPNTVPNVLTLPIWKEKYDIAAQKCLTNFGFLLGIGQHNWKSWTDEDIAPMLALTDDGLYFSGKGKLLAQFPEELGQLMTRFPHIPIALHCEDEALIEKNLEEQRALWNGNIPFSQHHLIRSTEACLLATQSCIEVAKKTGGRLHVLHVTSGAEAKLFDAFLPFEQKRITAEVCVQNLLFCSDDYARLGARIKWNPSIKTAQDRDELWEALLKDKIDIITTDHAPHLWEEKEGGYEQAISGAPMIQHSVNVMVDFYLEGRISLEQIVQKMCHRPAQLYGLKDRGFIAEGMKADLVILDTAAQWTVGKENLLYQCGWSPLEGKTFHNQIKATCVNGHWVYRDGQWCTELYGQPLRRES